MLTFLFWNIQKKPILPRVARLCATHAVDVLVLTECDATPQDVLAVLNANNPKPYCYPFTPSHRIQVFTRLPERQLATLYNDDNGRITIRKLKLNRKPPILLCAVHLLSQNDTTDSDRAAHAQRIAGYLREQEDRERMSRTVLVGDFNMNPFDNAVVNGEVFHALMTRDLAERRNLRIIQGERRRTFFNPMWQFLTDRGKQPAGTYYFHRSVPLNHYWHTFDQVLVRPELMDKLVSVDILDTDGVDSFLSADGWPDDSVASDHLPLLFRLDV